MAIATFALNRGSRPRRSDELFRSVLDELRIDPNLRDKEGLTALDWCSSGRRYLDGPGDPEVEAILRPLTTE